MADSFRSRLRQAANRLLAPLGLHLVRAERAFEMEDLLARAARRGVEVGTFVDVGASDGVWSLKARRFFPSARFLLFEPLIERQPALQKLRSRYGFELVAAAAGAQAGTVSFQVDPELDGSGVTTSGGGQGSRSVPCETVDGAVERARLPGPYCLKLDTHGYEIPVLTGAAEVLARAELLIIEAYNFALTPDTLRFPELCGWLEARGFRCCDLADPMRRPGDGAFWQMDLAFVPATSPLFASNRYG